MRDSGEPFIIHPLMVTLILAISKGRSDDDCKEFAENQVRAIMKDRVEAVKAKDLNRLMSNHAPDVLVFDVINPLQYAGPDTVRKRA